MIYQFLIFRPVLFSVLPNLNSGVISLMRVLGLKYEHWGYKLDGRNTLLGNDLKKESKSLRNLASVDICFYLCI
jgi:hypothetical protein